MHPNIRIHANCFKIGLLLYYYYLTFYHVSVKTFLKARDECFSVCTVSSLVFLLAFISLKGMYS